jgi:hypothetical protein
VDVLERPGARLRRVLPVALGYALVAAAGVLLMHAPTLRYGFDYDDYHFVRPYSLTEVGAAFTGPWDPSGIEAPFFRPLAIALYAARFHFFGLNAEAHHALSLLMFGAAVLLFGVWVRTIISSTGAGLFAMVVLIVHPAMPYAAVAWVTNQMHLLAMLIVLGALLWWTQVRGRSARWWIPLIFLEAAALLVKEDGIMLVPAIVTLHLLYGGLVDPPLRLPPPAFLLAALATAGALLALRHGALQGLTGYAAPDWATAWQNFRRGFESAFWLSPVRRPWQLPASWFVTLVPLAGCFAWRRIAAPARFCLAAGLALGVLFNLPFVVVVKVQQLHLVGLSAALLLTGASVGLVQLDGRHVFRAATAAVLAVGILLLAVVSRDITRDFEPFGPIILATDRLVAGWAAVPAELRDYLAEKREPGAASRLPSNPADALRSVVFNVHAWETGPNGRRFRWMAGGETEIEVSASARSVVLPLRHEIGLFRESAHARVELNGRTVDSVQFDSGEWRTTTILLRGVPVPRLRKMHRIVVRTDLVWIPSITDPRVGDIRKLGLQLGELQLR